MSELLAVAGRFLSDAYRVAEPERLLTPTPVSYTHLRAHETVLDLVCRLLLEKKKNTTLYITDLLNTDQL